MPDRLATTLCGIPLRNPVLAASGTFGYGIEFAKLVDLNQLGGLVTKGLSREPIAGNPAPRLWHTEGGMINSVGLQNVGVAAFILDKLPKLRTYAVPVIANVFGYAIEDYLAVIERLEDAEGIAAYELNVSCPNTKEGGIFFSSDPELLSNLIGRVRRSGQAAVDREALSQCRADRTIRARSGASGRRRHFSDQHLCLFSDRCEHAHARESEPALAVFRGQPSSLWLCAWSMKRRRRCAFP